MALTILGVDYSFSRPSIPSLKAGGVKFAMRYLSGDPRKNLSKAEKDALFNSGISVGVVWESTAGRARGGKAAGIADARAAVNLLWHLGLGDIPVYFAVDFDATDKDKPLIHQYLLGAGQVLGKNRVGVYGGYWVVKYAVDHKSCNWFWQTYAWSGGNLHPRTHIYQYRNGATIGNGSVDMNHASPEAFGSLRGPASPKPAADERKAKVWERHLNKARDALRHTLAHRAQMRKDGHDKGPAYAASTAKMQALKIYIAALEGLLKR